MEYIIDTSIRVTMWKKVLPSATIVGEPHRPGPQSRRRRPPASLRHYVGEAGPGVLKLSTADVVFAHIPEDFDHRITQQALSVGTPAQVAIKQFRAALIAAAKKKKKNAPILIAYSGDEISPGTALKLRQAYSKALGQYPVKFIHVVHGVGSAVNRVPTRIVLLALVALSRHVRGTATGRRP